jgi:hypothetical protein
MTTCCCSCRKDYIHNLQICPDNSVWWGGIGTLLPWLRFCPRLICSHSLIGLIACHCRSCLINHRCPEFARHFVKRCKIWWRPRVLRGRWRKLKRMMFAVAILGLSMVLDHVVRALGKRNLTFTLGKRSWQRSCNRRCYIMLDSVL